MGVIDALKLHNNFSGMNLDALLHSASYAIILLDLLTTGKEHPPR